MTSGTSARVPAREQTPSHSRRAFLRCLSAAACVPILPALAGDGTLPPGAASFNQVLAAQKQWESLSQILSEDREITDSDWDNLRGYLRTVYSVSGDMESLAKKWDKGLRERAKDVIKGFRTELKSMDQPAKERNTAQFIQKYERVKGIFNDFFVVFSEATVADIPAEL